jgi:hypothetical protein
MSESPDHSSTLSSMPSVSSQSKQIKKVSQSKIIYNQIKNNFLEKNIAIDPKDLKKMAQKERNKIAAKESRDNRKSYIVRLEEENGFLKEKILSLES